MPSTKDATEIDVRKAYRKLVGALVEVICVTCVTFLKFEFQCWSLLMRPFDITQTSIPAHIACKPTEMQKRMERVCSLHSGAPTGKVHEGYG